MAFLDSRPERETRELNQNSSIFPSFPKKSTPHSRPEPTGSAVPTSWTFLCLIQRQSCLQMPSSTQLLSRDRTTSAALEARFALASCSWSKCTSHWRRTSDNWQLQGSLSWTSGGNKQISSGPSAQHVIATKSIRIKAKQKKCLLHLLKKMVNQSGQHWWGLISTCVSFPGYTNWSSVCTDHAKHHVQSHPYHIFPFKISQTKQSAMNFRRGLCKQRIPYVWMKPQFWQHVPEGQRTRLLFQTSKMYLQPTSANTLKQAPWSLHSPSHVFKLWHKESLCLRYQYEHSEALKIWCTQLHNLARQGTNTQEAFNKLHGGYLKTSPPHCNQVLPPKPVLAQLCNPTAKGSRTVPGLFQFFGVCNFVQSPAPEIETQQMRCWEQPQSDDCDHT